MVTWACGHFHILTQTSPSQGMYAATYLGSKELSLGARKFSLVFKTPKIPTTSPKNPLSLLHRYTLKEYLLTKRLC